LSVISRKEQPGFARLSISAVLMGAGIGTMHYSGMAAMQPEALLRYDPAWAGVSIFTAVALGIRFRFRRSHSSRHPGHLDRCRGDGLCRRGMHYAAMRAALFFRIPASSSCKWRWSR
jgi:NO-binding membrane sensor protein with MHYT domain